MQNQIARITLTLIGFVCFRYLIRSVSKLPQEHYFEPFLTLEVVKLLPSRPDIIALTCLLLLFLIFRWNKARNNWSELAYGSTIQVLVISCALILTWAYSCYGFNYYYNQWHLWDRMLLVVLFILLIRFPVFILPFILQVSIIAWQSSFDENFIAWAFPDMPLNLLILFAVSLLFSAISGYKEDRSFMFLIICLIGSHYFPPGFAKLKLGWLWDNSVHLFLPSTYSNGWLAMLDPGTIGRITQALQPLDPFIRFGTIIMEFVAPFLVLLKRRFALIFIPLWALFHLAIFGLSGIFLWMWILCELTLFGLILLNKHYHEQAGLADPKLRLAGIVIISLSFLWLKPSKLSWMDSGINYVYNFEVECSTGRYLISPGYFTPFNFRFAVSDFGFLVKQPLLPVSWGATNRKTAKGTRAAMNRINVLAYEKSNGKIYYDENRKDWFIKKIRRLVTNINNSREQSRSLGFMESPPTVVRFAGSNSWDGQEQIEKLHIYQSLWYFDGKEPVEIRRMPLLALEIP